MRSRVTRIRASAFTALLVFGALSCAGQRFRHGTDWVADSRPLPSVAAGPMHGDVDEAEPPSEVEIGRAIAPSTAVPGSDEADLVEGVVYRGGPHDEPVPLANAVVIACAESFDLLSGVQLTTTDEMLRELCLWLQRHGCKPDGLPIRPGLAALRKKWHAYQEAMLGAPSLDALMAALWREVPDAATATRLFGSAALDGLFSLESWLLAGLGSLPRGGDNEILVRLGAEAPIAWALTDEDGRYALRYDDVLARARLLDSAALQFVRSDLESERERRLRVVALDPRQACAALDVEGVDRDALIPTDYRYRGPTNHDGTLDFYLEAPLPAVRIVVRRGQSGYAADLDIEAKGSADRLGRFGTSGQPFSRHRGGCATNKAFYFYPDASDGYVHVRVKTPWGDDIDVINVPLTGETVQELEIELRAVGRATLIPARPRATFEVDAGGPESYRIAWPIDGVVDVPVGEHADRTAVDGIEIARGETHDLASPRVNAGASVHGYIDAGRIVPYAISNVYMLDADSDWRLSDLYTAVATWLETPTGERVPCFTSRLGRDLDTAEVTTARVDVRQYATGPRPIEFRSGCALNLAPHVLRMGFTVHGVPPGRYRVAFGIDTVNLPSSGDWIPKQVVSALFVVSDGADGTADVGPVVARIQHSARLEVEVVDPHGHPVDRARVRALPVWANMPPDARTASERDLYEHGHRLATGFQQRWWDLDWQGARFVDPRLTPRDYVLLVDADGLKPSVLALRLRPGETHRIRVDLDRGAVLRGRVSAPVALDGLVVSLLPLDVDETRIIAERFYPWADWREDAESFLMFLARPLLHTVKPAYSLDPQAALFEVTGLIDGQTYQVRMSGWVGDKPAERTRYEAPLVLWTAGSEPLELELREQR